MAEVGSTGMGQGYAQVFETGSLANQYQNNMRLGLYQQQQEQMAIQKMLATMDADRGKMRSVDIAELDKKYTQLKELYAQNKGLYRTPAKFPLAYQESLKLQSEMRQLIGESMQQNTYLNSILDGAAKNQDMYGDDVVTYIKQINAMPTSKIKTINGGSLVTPLHLQHQPAAINFVKEGEALIKYAELNNGVTPQIQQERISDAQLLERKWQDIKPEAAIVYSSQRMLDPSFRRSMASEYNNAATVGDGKKLKDLKSQLDAYLGGKTFDITDGGTYAAALFVTQFKRTADEVSTKTRPEYAGEQRVKGIILSDRLSKQRIRLAASLRPSSSSSSSGDKTAMDAAGVVLALQSGDKNALNSVVGSLEQLIGPSVSTTERVKWIGGKYKKDGGMTYDAFKKGVQMYNANAYSPTYRIEEGDDYLKKVYEQGGAILAIPVDVEDKNKTKSKKYILVSGHKGSGQQEATKVFSILSSMGSPKPSQKFGAFRGIDPAELGVDENGE